jgi:lipopolysaccharide export system protein LptC
MNLKSVKTYSHFVRFSKVSLSLLVIIVMVFMVAVPLIAKRGSDMRLAFAAIEERDMEEQPAMIKPTFQGVDENNNPYKINAAKAIQQSDEVILLQQVEAELTLEDGELLFVSANSGVYNLDDGNLLLEGDVWIYHEAGHDMQTEHLRVNTKQMAAYGDSPVQILSPYGRLRSDNFSIVERGNRLLFNKNVKMLLHR